MTVGRPWVPGAEDGLASDRPGLGGPRLCCVALLASVIYETGVDMTSAVWGPEM